MTDETANEIAATSRKRTRNDAEIPEAVRRRYFVDGRGGAGLGYYVDAQVQTPAFRDSGRRLIAGRTDPNVIRDMVRIAQHRQWAVVRVEGEPTFRREAWLAAASLGLEVRGYKPTARDRQDLERSLQRSRSRTSVDPTPPMREPSGQPSRDAAAHLRVVETVVRARIVEPSAQARILDAAKHRLADLLERGARLRPLDRVAPPPQRKRTRDRVR